MPQYIGTVYLDVRADTTKLGGDLSRKMGGIGGAAGATGGAALTKSLGDKLLQFGTQATRVGRQISFGLSAPLIALGAKSEQAFVAYDTQLTKVSALTNAGVAQTAAWGDQVLNLASEFGVAGEDAAKALYLITSSGITGQAAMDTLRVTLKATAVGMGDTATIAGLLTSAMNAYAAEGLTAAHAADILTGAVQESKIPADQLAGSISNLLPFGHQLGVSFEQIVGSMAGLSLQGTNAAQAATQLRGIFAGLLDPSEQAAQQFLRIGLNAKQLQETLKTGGIVGVIKQISDATVAHGLETDEALANTFGNVRALTGAFGLLGEKVPGIIANATNSLGKLDKAFLVTADTAGFKARQATEGLHNEMVKLGESIAPVAAGLLGAARAGLEFIDALGPAKPVVISLGVALAAIGPLTYSIGAASSLLGGIVTGFASVTAASAGVAVATEANVAAQAQLVVAQEAVAAAAAAEAFALNAVGGSAAAAAAAQQAGVAAAAELTVAEEAAATAAAELATAESAAGVAAAIASPAVVAFAAAAAAALAPVAVLAAGLAASFIVWNKAMAVGQTHVDSLNDAINNKLASGGIAEGKKAIDGMTSSVNALIDDTKTDNALNNFLDADYYKTLGDTVDMTARKVQEFNADVTMARSLAASTQGNADSIFQWLENERNAGHVYTTNAEALTAYNAAMAAHAPAADAAAAATGNLADKAKELEDKFFGAVSAQTAYNDSLTKVGDAQRALADAGRAVVDARQAEVDSVHKVADAQDAHRDALLAVVDAQRKLVESQKALAEELKGPTPDELLDVKQAKLNLRKVRKTLSDPTADPLDRQQNRIDLQRAKAALTDAQGAHGKNLAKAQDDVAAAQAGVTDAQKNAVSTAKAITDAQRGVEDAHRAVEDAQRKQITATQDLAEAQTDSVAAADALYRKQQDLANAIIAGKDGAGPLIGYLTELKGLYPEIAGAIQPFIEKAQALEDFFHPPVPPPPPPSDPYGGSRPPSDRNPHSIYNFGTARAFGGPLSGGQESTVNEKGLPELWSQGGKQYLLPVRNGRVTPLLPADIPVKGGDSGLTMGDINVYESSGRPRQTAFEVRREIRKEAFLAGRRS